MINAGIREFIEKVGQAIVATSDAEGNPHLAAGRGVSVSGSNLIVFEAWFCQTTLKNLQQNPKIAVVVADTGTGNGYQFAGRVEKTEDTAILDGFLPGAEPAGTPQVQWRLVVRVDTVMAFSAGAHSDRPLG